MALVQTLLWTFGLVHAAYETHKVLCSDKTPTECTARRMSMLKFWALISVIHVAEEWVDFVLYAIVPFYSVLKFLFTCWIFMSSKSGATLLFGIVAPLVGKYQMIVIRHMSYGARRVLSVASDLARRILTSVIAHTIPYIPIGELDAHEQAVSSLQRSLKCEKTRRLQQSVSSLFNMGLQDAPQLDNRTLAREKTKLRQHKTNAKSRSRPRSRSRSRSRSRTKARADRGREFGGTADSDAENLDTCNTGRVWNDKLALYSQSHEVRKQTGASDAQVPVLRRSVRSRRKALRRSIV